MSCLFSMLHSERSRSLLSKSFQVVFTGFKPDFDSCLYLIHECKILKEIEEAQEDYVRLLKSATLSKQFQVAKCQIN